MESWHWLVWPALAIGAVAALFGLDRLGLWLEDRGWLYYRRKKPTSSPMTALVAIQQAIDPGIRHVVEVKHHQRSEKEKAADRERLVALLVEVLRVLRRAAPWCRRIGRRNGARREAGEP